MTKQKPATMSFADLVAQIARAQGHDPEALATEQANLTAEIDGLEVELAQAKSSLSIVLSKLAEPVRQAVKAAPLIGIEVPSEFRTGKANGKRNGGGAYHWVPGALPNSTRTEDLTPRTWEISRAMWAFSRGSNGSAGRSGEGVLTVDEFRHLMKEQVGVEELAPGQVAEVVLPNGRPLRVERMK